MPSLSKLVRARQFGSNKMSKKGYKQTEEHRKKVSDKLKEFFRQNRIKKGLPEFGVLKYPKDKVKAKEYNRRYLYGITSSEYNEMFSVQNGLCAICFNAETAKSCKGDKIKELAVDHCHNSGKIRGLLCHKCNMLLGYASDNSHILKAAANYLNNFVK